MGSQRTLLERAQAVHFPVLRRFLSIALLLALLSPALAHSGHLELQGFRIEQQGGRSFVFGVIRYPQSDTRLELQAVSSPDYVATLERENNGRWAQVSRIPIDGDLTLDEDSPYRLALSPVFDYAALEGQTLPVSFLFGQGGVQVLEVRVGASENPMWTWAAAGLGGVLLGVAARVLWVRSKRGARRRRVSG